MVDRGRADIDRLIDDLDGSADALEDAATDLARLGEAVVKPIIELMEALRPHTIARLPEWM